MVLPFLSLASFGALWEFESNSVACRLVALHGAVRIWSQTLADLKVYFSAFKVSFVVNASFDSEHLRVGMKMCLSFGGSEAEGV